MKTINVGGFALFGAGLNVHALEVFISKAWISRFRNFAATGSALLIALLAVLVAGVGPVEAFTLQPANSVGRGKSAIFGGLISTIASDVPTQILTYGVLGKYGLTDWIDLSAGYGVNNLYNTPPGVTPNSSNLLGAGIKVQWLNEAPVSVATSLIYTGFATSLTAGGAPATQFIGDAGVKLTVSKILWTAVPILPYCALTYRTLNTTTTNPLGTVRLDERALEYTLGSYVLLSRQLAGFLEYSSTRRTAHNGGPSATTTEWSSGVSWVF